MRRIFCLFPVDSTLQHLPLPGAQLSSVRKWSSRKRLGTNVCAFHTPILPSLLGAPALQHIPCPTHNCRRSQSGHPGHGPATACLPSIQRAVHPSRRPGAATPPLSDAELLSVLYRASRSLPGNPQPSRRPGALQHHPCLTHDYRRSQSGHPDHGPVKACEPSIRLINGPFIAFRCPGDATLCSTHIYRGPQNGHPSTGPDTACSSSVADFVLGIASL